MKRQATLILLIVLGIASPGATQGRVDRPFFFQEGQYQLDQQIQKLQRQQREPKPQQKPEVPSSLLTIDDGTLRWQKYLFKDGGFSVWMPTAIQSQETKVLETSIGKVSFDVFATQPKSFRFIAAYSEPIQSQKIKDSKQFLESMRDSIVQETKL
jgi:hypothetical protein